MTSTPEMLTTNEAAKVLYTTENSLRSMRVTGHGPPFRKVGHRVFYVRDELDAYVAKMRPSDITRMAVRRDSARKERGASTA